MGWIRLQLIILLCFLGLHLQAQFCYISPLPNSDYHPCETGIIFKTCSELADKEVQDADRYNITGSRSGIHSFNLMISGNNTILLNPDSPFTPGEFVTVNYVDCENRSLEFRFTVSKFDKPVNLIDDYLPREVSQKDFSGYFPPMQIDSSAGMAPGKIFFYNISAMASNNDRFMAIINSSGEPVFSRQENNRGINFALQPNGLLSFFHESGSFHLMDSSYASVDTFSCRNGYTTDWHELVVDENGHAFLLSYDEQQVDMSLVVPGGNPQAIVEGCVIQELDEQKNVVFQWRSWDHYSITDATHVDFTTELISYVHGNALKIDTDGNLLFSARRLDEITKIDRNTGSIIWRFGGKNNQFSIAGSDTLFTRQHDISRLENGHLLLYDNGNFNDSISRVREYSMDLNSMTVEQTWMFQHPVDVFANVMGSAQRLPNGNTFINWGWVDLNEQPAFTEVDSDGNIVYELVFTTPYHFVYRARKNEWNNPFDTLSIDDLFNADAKIKIYPNPAKDKFFVETELYEKGSVRLELIDLFGRVHEEVLEENSSEIVRRSFNVSGLAPGNYFLRVSYENQAPVFRRIMITN